MTRLSPTDLDLCAMQGSLFEKSLEMCSCSSAVFVRRFMNSRLATRFDEGSLLFESTTFESLFDEIDAQYGPSSYGSGRFGAEALYWMGYLYRYWSEAFGLSSKRVYKIIQARELNSLYYAYHSLDPAQAIERICEAKGVLPCPPNHSEGYIEEGVELLRKIRARGSVECFAVTLDG